MGSERKGRRSPGRADRLRTVESGGDAPATPRWLPFVLAGSIAALTVWVYSSVGGHEFVDFDDHDYVVGNPHLDGRLEWRDVWVAFAEPYNSNWSPLTSLSLASSDALHGENPGAYALTNVGLHVLASLFLLLAFGHATGRWLASAFVAAVFAVHPLHVESVAWISERKDVLAGLFWMAALSAHPAAVRQRSRAARAAVIVFGLGAMLAKATAVALPVTLVLFDIWPLGRVRSVRDLRDVVVEKWPLLAGSAALSVVTYLVQTEAGANSTWQTSALLRVLNAGPSYAIYVADSVWPAWLAYFHPFPADEVLLAPMTWLLLAVVLLATVLALASIFRRPLFAMGWLWFVATLVPMIGLVRVGGQSHADRYTYIAQTGLVAIVAFGLPDRLMAFAPTDSARRRLRGSIGVLALVCVLALAATARRQVGYWHDSITLFRHAIEISPDDARSHRGLGINLWERGEREEGAHHLQEALRINPSWGEARLVWATALLQMGRLDEAEREIAFAGQTGADPAMVFAALGVLADRLGDAKRAVDDYERALALELEDWEVENNLAWIRATHPDAALRDATRAVELAERAARRKPDHAFVQGTLAAAYAAAGRQADAIAAQTRAIQLLRGVGDARTVSDFSDRLERYRVGRPPWDGAGASP